MSDQSTYPPPSRLLPTSNALAEAEPQSMQELFSRNPELYSESNIDAIVLQMRDLRLRLEQTATAGRTRAIKDPDAPKGRGRSRAYVPSGGMKGLLDDDDDDDC